MAVGRIISTDDDSTRKQLARFFKALADENRLQIIHLLLEQELCVCEIIELMELSQPAVSHHLRLLKEAGLVKDRRDGKWIYYSINPGSFLKYDEAYLQHLKNPLKKLNKSKTSTRQNHPLCKRLQAQEKTNL